jgi:general secretion pathway protein J
MRRDAGFTLLELLVALVVFGLLLAGLTQSVRLGLRAWDAQTRTIARSGDLDAVDRLLRGIITRMQPGRLVDPPNIAGNAASLAFTSVLPEGAAALANRDADMLLRVDGGELVLQWVPHRHVRPLGPPPPPQEARILDDVAQLRIGYYAAGGWRSEWHDRVPPELVRVQIIFAAQSPRTWPAIVVAPLRRRADG